MIPSTLLMWKENNLVSSWLRKIKILSAFSEDSNYIGICERRFWVWGILKNSQEPFPSGYLKSFDKYISERVDYDYIRIKRRKQMCVCLHTNIKWTIFPPPSKYSLILWGVKMNVRVPYLKNIEFQYNRNLHHLKHICRKFHFKISILLGCTLCRQIEESN